MNDDLNINMFFLFYFKLLYKIYNPFRLFAGLE